MQVSEGDELIVVLEDEGVRLLTPEQAVRRAQRIVAEHVAASRSLSRELVEERHAEESRG